MVTLKQKHGVVLILLSACLLLQAGYLLPGLGRSVLQIWNVLGKNALWRSAYFTQGKKFADYVVFLNEKIPVGARVVLPPAVVEPKELSVTPLMQFFLMPRQVINCNELNCLPNLSPAQTYILIVGEFPEGLPDPRFGSTVMFDDQWGVLMPEAAGIGDLSTSQDYGSVFDILKVIVFPLSWLGLVGLSGLLIVNSLLPEETWLFKASLGYGLGLCLLSWGVALAFLLGVKLSPACYLVITVMLVAAALVVSLINRRLWSGRVRDNRVAQLPRIDRWTVLILLLGCVAALVSLGKGFSASDEIMLWGVKGYAIAAIGALSLVMDWGTNTVYYPLHVPIVISAFRALFTDAESASKIVFSGYFTALALLAYSHLRRQGWMRSAAGLCALLPALTPLVFRHATIAYTNLTLSYYLVAAVMLLSQAALSPEPKAKPSRLLLSSLCFAAAAWTRPEGLLMSWLGVGLVLAFVFFTGRWKFSFQQLAPLVFPLLGYSLFWSWLKTQVYTRPAAKADLAAGALRQVLAGNWHIQDAGFILRSVLSSLIQIGTWGTLGIILVGVGVWYILVRPRLRAGPSVMLATGILYAAVIAGVYYVTSYDTTHDIGWWVNTGLDRMILPVIWLIWLGGMGSAAQLFDNGVDRAAPADG